MRYDNIIQGIFLKRPNRFIAQVLVEGVDQTVHVKNTGRCRELLVPGATVYLERANNPARRTNFSLVAVEKQQRLINMDSSAPNKLLGEALDAGFVLPGFPHTPTVIKREVSYGQSRLDFAVEFAKSVALIEVKGVTLEEDGVVLFPDAPTQRGVRHIEELVAAVKDGYDAHIVFIIQMQGVKYFTPNNQTQPAFGAALIKAKEQGVGIHAFDCRVQPGEIWLNSAVPVCL